MIKTTGSFSERKQSISLSAAELSVALLAEFLLNAILGMIAGTPVDRISRKAAMIGADLFIASVSLLLVFVSLDGMLEIWLILSVLAARSVGTPRWFAITGALLVALAVWMYRMPSIRNID